MSQPFDNDFNNNQNPSASDIQNVNNSEAELQQTSEEKSVDMESDNIQTADQDISQDDQERPEDKERSDADTNVGSSENQPETASEETASSPDASDKDEKEESEPDIPNNPVDDFPKETSSNEANVNNCNTEAASDQSTSDISNNNNKKFEEKIQKKIDAVKDFAFCKKKVSFPFFQEKYNEIPVYPYVAALTGHRDAVITDAVRETAKKQLRSLAQSWDKACKGRSWLIIPKKTAPLIVLIGLGDGESGKLWAEIAAELRDNEKYNIKIVAVASMPLKDMVNILSNHRALLSQDKDFIDAKNSFDYILEKADGLIELPYDQDVKDYIKLYEDLEKNCTGDNAAHSDELFQILFNGSKAFQDIQYKEYRKFMCIHSHVLLALTENATNWESANLSGIDINELNNDASEKAMPKDSLLIPLKEKDDARKALEELNSQITELKNRGCKPQKFEELIGSFETLAGSLFKKFAKPIPRTNAMIFYKLFGNVDSALIPTKHIVNGISFTSIGPVVCIHTKRSSSDTDNENTQNSKGSVIILVKDQPNDTKSDLIKDIPWNDKDISQFDEIRDVISECGGINKKLFNKSKHSRKTDIPASATEKEAAEKEAAEKEAAKKEVIKEFLETHSNNKQEPKVDNISIDEDTLSLVKHIDEDTLSLVKHIDEDTLSLVKHHNSAKKLSQHYYWWMKFWTRLFAIVAVLLFSLFGIGTAIEHKTTLTFSNCGIGILFFTIWLYSCFKVYKYYHYFEALASGLKVQIFWNLAEVNEDVPGQFYLHQINDIAWLRVAFNGLLATESASSLNSSEINDIEQSQKHSSKCKFVKRNWINSTLNQIAGKSNFNDKELLFEKLKQIEPFLKILSPTGGYGAGLGYIVLNSLLINGPAFSVITKIILCFLTLLFSVIAVYNVYRKTSLKELDIKRRHQLLYPYRRAQLLYGIKMKYWENSQEFIRENGPSQNDNKNSDWKVIINSYQECQKILEDLGRIELAINAEWLLGLKDREFNLSDEKNDIELKCYKFRGTNYENKVKKES